MSLPKPYFVPINISVTTTKIRAMEILIRKPTNMCGNDSGKIIFMKIDSLSAFRTFATFILDSLAFLTPYIVYIMITRQHEKITTEIFAVSPMPKKSKNIGKRAEAGIERKKSIRNSRESSSFLDDPTKKPSGIPIIIDKEKPKNSLYNVPNKSFHISPE
jgi:hypothetical protein